MRSETAASPGRLRDALRGLRLYQEAPRLPPPPPMPVAARVGRVALRDYGGSGPAVIVVPSLINPPSVLDLAEDNSLLRWLAGQGLRPLLLDWESPAPDERDLTIAGHVERYLLPLIAAIGGRPALVGYCLGGTMALAAAARADVSALVLIAAPWRFSGFTEAARTGLADLWRHAEPAATALGVLPMEVLQTSFWQLDPSKTVAKFERLGRGAMPPAAIPGFIALEDWANDGPPLTYAAGRGLIHDFVGADETGRGVWQVGGSPVVAERLACPVLDIVSTTDRIVPAASAAGIGTGLSLGLGHVGMIVGGRARSLLWEPMAEWLRQAIVLPPAPTRKRRSRAKPPTVGPGL
ncbi:alpha/beta hydrolase [Sphingomonas solaris]|uniref:alpha/beta hydrolase n=1 Tax=Alterirhizorhabdus solaris TaxID=2529389 RepID=UPI001EEFF399|nr:alpha/beta hydrolase [Sphingomonas solaris]